MSIVGVDLGGTKILARLIDPLTGAAAGRSKVKTPRSDPEQILDAVVETVRSLAGSDKAEAIGLGMPGLVSADGIVGPCPNLVGWSEPIPVREFLETELCKPVTVANDVNCGALAEARFGAGATGGDFLAVFVGTGVGGGLIRSGELVSGQRGMAGEIGHVTVRPGGRPCGCGGHGHLEAYAGRAGIEAEARRRVAGGEQSMLIDLAHTGTVKSRHIARALMEQDPLAVELMAEAADALAVAIGDAATLLDLPLVVLGGGVVDKLGQPFVDAIVGSGDFGGFGRDVCELKLAERLDDAGALGAAMAAHVAI